MIITCPSCKKKFEVNENLIPNEGRLLKCGSCNQTWFFNKNDKTETQFYEASLSIDKADNSQKQKTIEKKREKISKPISNIPIKKGSELIKYKKKPNYTFVKFLNYLIVLIISFIALIIVMDTFKGPLSIFFPNLESILYSLFETLKDLILFVKDLR